MKIATHNGSFHADDIFAVATLSLVVGEAEVIRTRDDEKITDADYVVDVGLVYDPAKHRFDHHQPGGAGERDNGIPYASFGLVWKEFGEKLSGGGREMKWIDRKLVQPIDAHDNGFALSTSILKDVREYSLEDFLYSYMTSDLKKEDIDSLFMNLVDVCKALLLREIKKSKQAILGEDLLEKVYKATEDKRIIELPEDEKNIPWASILGQFEEPLFVIYPRTDGGWGVKAVRDPNKPYGTNRRNLPASWAGKAGEELQNITGVPDAVFAHRGLFMAAAKSKEGARRLAQIALNS